MRSTLKLAVILAFIGIAASFLVLPESAWVKPAAASGLGQARDLYIRNCARCHGSDGIGNTELGKKLFVPNLREERGSLSNAKMVRVITNGKADMPGFGKTLNKRQIATLAAYVRKL